MFRCNLISSNKQNNEIMNNLETTNVLYHSRFHQNENRFSLDSNPVFGRRVHNSENESDNSCKITNGAVRIGLLVGFIALYYFITVVVF